MSTDAARLLARKLITSVGLVNLTRLYEVTVVGKGNELTPAEVAGEFNVSPATVRRWEKSGILAPTRRMPRSGHRRYSRADVDALHARLKAGDYQDVVKPAANRAAKARAEDEGQATDAD